MDQVRIGQFIKALRKEKSLTQREVAKKLNISEKTVSKWETGNGLPEVALMMPLCELLAINVNELLSGERLDEKRYFTKAEENMMSLVREREEAKKKIMLEAIVCTSVLLAGITLCLVAGLLDMAVYVRVILIAIAALVIAGGVTVACVLDRDAGVFECPLCGEQFVPTMKAYVLAPHTFVRRKLMCPQCGKKSFCEKKLGRKEA